MCKVRYISFTICGRGAPDSTGHFNSLQTCIETDLDKHTGEHLVSLVSLVRLKQPTMSLPRAIEKALDLIRFTFPKTISHVAIKPNLCYYWDHSTGETTDPQFVSALIDTIRKKTFPRIKITVVESDASAMRCKYAFKMLGYEKMAQEKSVELVNLTEAESLKVTVNINHRSHEFAVPQIITAADLLINVPKIKYMQQVKMSCALKNIFGCNPYPKKFVYHEWLDEAIVSLNKITKSDLYILDGITVSGTETLRLGLVMASTDPVALDSAAARIAGINPHTVQHIVLAQKEKIGSIDFISRGDELSYFENLFPGKDLKYRMRGLLSTLYNRFLA